MKLSASQVNLYLRCPRAYALTYVEKQVSPPSPKQQFGTDVHSQLERWLRDGIPPDDTPEGRVANQGIRNDWLPPPSSKLLIEKEFLIPWFEDEGVYMRGFVDCCDPRGVPLVLDHKTTSNLKWAMTEEDLAGDPQALIYSLWAALEYNASLVRARWVYYSASNPKNGPRKPQGALPVEILFKTNSSEYIDKIQWLLDTTGEMINIRSNEIRGSECEPKPENCGAYGGCFHRGKGCVLDQFESTKGFF